MMPSQAIRSSRLNLEHTPSRMAMKSASVNVEGISEATVVKMNSHKSQVTVMLLLQALTVLQTVGAGISPVKALKMSGPSKPTTVSQVELR